MLIEKLSHIKRELNRRRESIAKEKNQIERLRMRIERRYRLKCTVKEIRETLTEMEVEWRERDRIRRERWELESLKMRGEEEIVEEEPTQGLNRNRGENGRERRTELTFKLINIQGLSEVKLRWLEDRFFGDINDESMKHVILCLTETQQKMRKFRERPDLVSYIQMREGGIRTMEGYIY